MSHTPAVSIILPVYNAMCWIEEAVASVFAQTLTDWELVAVDDASTDGSWDYLKRVDDPRVRLLRNDNRSGLAWTILELEAAGGGRDALNARVEVRAGGRGYLRELRPHSSYLSSHEPIVHVGLGTATAIDTLRVVWPDGARETWTDLPVRERRERQNIVDRLRTLLDSGRTVLSVGEGEPLAPAAADDIDEGRDTEVDGHAHLGREESDE